VPVVVAKRVPVVVAKRERTVVAKRVPVVVAKRERPVVANRERPVVANRVSGPRRLRHVHFDRLQRSYERSKNYLRHPLVVVSTSDLQTNLPLRILHPLVVANLLDPIFVGILGLR
jgi:hypothetical protein